MPDAADKPRCAAQNKRGEPCRSYPIRGSTLCGAHDPTCASHAHFQPGHAPTSPGRPRKPRFTEVLRERIEAEVDAWLAPLVDARDNAVVVVASKDGADVTDEPDHAIRLKAVDQALKWVYALPKSGVDVDITPGVDGGVVVRLAFDPAGSNEESEESDG